IANVPGHWAGARIGVGAATLTRTSLFGVSTFSHAYISFDVAAPHAATKSVTGDVAFTVSCRIAVSVPSRRAASAIRWTVGGRCPTEVNIWLRVSIRRTGRPVIRAAITAAI